MIEYGELVIYGLDQRARVGIAGSRDKLTGKIRVVPVNGGAMVKRDEWDLITLSDIERVKKVTGKR